MEQNTRKPIAKKSVRKPMERPFRQPLGNDPFNLRLYHRCLFENNPLTKRKEISHRYQLDPQSSNKCCRITEIDPNAVLSQHVRTVCVLAHVDHGKTSLVDSLLTVNRHLSRASAGKMLFMDNRPDEQSRGITMKSSAMALFFNVQDIDSDSEAGASMVPHQLNLIDTPGHIDFSSEVVAAVRMCDGAFLVVDMVEGVCVQTRHMIRCAVQERVHMVLVLNKFDRLVVERKMRPNAIYDIIDNIIKECNVEVVHAGFDCLFTLAEVVIASAKYCWGVHPMDLLELRFKWKSYSESEKALVRDSLANPDAYLEESSNEVRLFAGRDRKPPAFLTVVVKPLWYVYHSLCVADTLRPDLDDYLIKLLGVTNTVRHLSTLDGVTKAGQILQAFAPLERTLTEACLMYVPSANLVSDVRLSSMLSMNHSDSSVMLTELNRHVDSLSVVPYGYVGKLIYVPSANIKALSKLDESIADRERPAYEIMGLLRLYRGRLDTRDKTCQLQTHEPTNDPNATPTVHSIQLDRLFVPWGTIMIQVDAVPVGALCAVTLKITEHLSRGSTITGWPGAVPVMQLAPTVPFIRNMVEPVNASQFRKLQDALRVLVRIDSCAQLKINQDGTMAIITAGDVHLEKCLEDLKTYAPDIPVVVSAPDMVLRETVAVTDTTTPTYAEVKEFKLRIGFTMRTITEDMVKAVNDRHAELLKLTAIMKRASGLFHIACSADERKSTFNRLQMDLQEHAVKEEDALRFCTGDDERPCESNDFVKISDIVSVGLTKGLGGTNMLISECGDWDWSGRGSLVERFAIEALVQNAFELACSAGPITGEPLSHCLIVLKEFSIGTWDDLAKVSLDTISTAQVTGAIRVALLDTLKIQKCQLMEPMYALDVYCPSRDTGVLVDLIARYWGEIYDTVLEDDNNPDQMCVKGFVSANEYAGYTEEVRQLTSGRAHTKYSISHYGIIKDRAEEDEEAEEEMSASRERNDRLIKIVRRRKGLPVAEQVVQHAEKQRTQKK